MMKPITPPSVQSAGSVPPSRSNTNLIARQIEVLFSAYRRADYSDPVGFVAQLGTVLQDYPEEVVIFVTSPQTGLQRRQKFPPSIPEVIEACNERVKDLARQKEAEAFRRRGPVHRLPAPPRAPGTDYRSMVEKHGRPIGRFEQGRG